MNGAALIGIVTLPLAGDHDVDAVIAENALKLDDVGEPGNILEDQRVLGEEAGDHQRERCILCARDRDSSVQTLAANDPDPIHVAPVSLQKARRSNVGTATTWVQAFPTQVSTFAGELRRKSGAESPWFDRFNRHEAVSRGASCFHRRQAPSGRAPAPYADADFRATRQPDADRGCQVSCLCWTSHFPSRRHYRPVTGRCNFAAIALRHREPCGNFRRVLRRRIWRPCALLLP